MSTELEYRQRVSSLEAELLNLQTSGQSDSDSSVRTIAASIELQLRKTNADLESQLETLRRENNGLGQIIVDLEKELKNLRTLEEELTQDKRTLQSQLYEQLNQISNLKSEVNELKFGTSHLKQEAASVQELRQLLQRERDAAQNKDKELSQLSEQLDQLHKDAKEKTEELAQAQAQMTVTKKQYEYQVSSLQEQMAELDELCRTLQVQVKNLKSQVDSTPMPQFAQNIIDEKNVEIDELTAEIENLKKNKTHPEIVRLAGELEARNRELQAQSAELVSKKAELQSQSAELQAKTIELQSKTTELQSKTTELQSKNKELQSKSEELQSKNTELQSKGAELQTKTAELKSKTAECERLQQVVKRLQQFEDKVKTIEKEEKTSDIIALLQTKKQAMAELTAQVQRLRNDVQMKDFDLTELREEKSQRDNEVSALNDSLQQKNIALDTLRQQIETMQNEIDKLLDFQTRLQGDFDSVQSMLEKKQSELEETVKELEKVKVQSTDSNMAEKVQLEETIRDLEKDIQYKKNIIDEKEEEIYELNERIEQQEVSLQQYQDQAGNLQTQLAEQLAEKNSEIYQLQERLRKSRPEAGVDLDSSIRLKDQIIQQLREEVTEKNEALNQLHLQLLSRQEAFSALKQQLEQATCAIEIHPAGVQGKVETQLIVESDTTATTQKAHQVSSKNGQSTTDAQLTAARKELTAAKQEMKRKDGYIERLRKHMGKTKFEELKKSMSTEGQKTNSVHRTVSRDGQTEDNNETGEDVLEAGERNNENVMRQELAEMKMELEKRNKQINSLFKELMNQKKGVEQQRSGEALMETSVLLEEASILERPSVGHHNVLETSLVVRPVMRADESVMHTSVTPHDMVSPRTNQPEDVDNILKMKEDAIRQLMDEVANKNQELYRLQQELQEKEEELAGKTSPMGTLEQGEPVHMIIQLQERDDKIKILEEKLTAEEQKVKVKEEDLRKALQHLNQLRGQLDEQERQYSEQIMIIRTSKDAVAKQLAELQVQGGQLTQAQIDELKRSHDRDVLEACQKERQESAKKIDELVASYERQMRKLKENLEYKAKDTLERTLKELKEKHQKELKQLKKLHEEEVEALSAVDNMDLTDLETIQGIVEQIHTHLDGEGSRLRRLNDTVDKTSIKVLIRDLMEEGGRILELSEDIMQRRQEMDELEHAWNDEKHSLLGAIGSLKELLATVHKGQDPSQFSDGDGTDWRADLIRAVHQVFAQEREGTQAHLRTLRIVRHDKTAQLDELSDFVHIQCERQSQALEALQDADRQSLLTEVRSMQQKLSDLEASAREEKLGLLRTVDQLTEQINKQREELKQQNESLQSRLEHEEALISDLQTDLEIERARSDEQLQSLNRERQSNLQLECDLASLQTKLAKAKDELDREGTKVQAAQSALEGERRQVAVLQERLIEEEQTREDLKAQVESAKRRHVKITAQARLQQELDSERALRRELETTLDAERLTAQSLRRELEMERGQGERTKERAKVKINEIKVQLDAEKHKNVLLNSDLRKVQLDLDHLKGVVIQERQAAEDATHRETTAIKDLEAMVDEERSRMKTLQGDLEVERVKVRELLKQLDKEHDTAQVLRVEERIVTERAKLDRDRATLNRQLSEAQDEVRELKMQLQGAVDASTMGDRLPGNDKDKDKLQRLYSRYLRAESFRKSLVYQKKYLLLLVGGFRQGEADTLAVLRTMVPTPPGLSLPSGVSRPRHRFRSAVRVVIAVTRLKNLVTKWKRASRLGAVITTHLSNGTGNNLIGSSVRIIPAGDTTRMNGVRRSHDQTNGHVSPVAKKQIKYSPRTGHLDEDFNKYIRNLEKLEAKLEESGATTQPLKSYRR